jgi:hypothetical protein
MEEPSRGGRGLWHSSREWESLLKATGVPEDLENPGDLAREAD